MKIAEMHRQSGAALIIGLIFLVLLAVLGLGSLRNVTLQERITGNHLDGYRAQHNADVALLMAEENVATTGSNAQVMYMNTSNAGVNYALSTLWDNCDDTTVTDENLCEVLASGARVKYETTAEEDTYIITVWATGSANASVMLQSTYAGRLEEQQ